MKKIYIAGCGGMLGEAFYKQFDEFELRCSDIDLNEKWLHELDFRNLDAYRKEVLSFKPDILVHLGAHTDLEYCETHVDDAYATNTMAVENAVLIANEIDVPVVYISTAGIFDGSKDVFDDWDLPNPLGHYARSKYAGELYVAQRARRHLICRAGWMMGGGPTKDKKFIQKLMKQLKAGKKELHIVSDKLGTPTYTHDFALNVRQLLDAELWGLYNMVCDGLTSRLEVARELVNLLDLTDEVKITEVSSEFFAKEYFAQRPDSERLVNRKLGLRGMNSMRDWRIGLKEYLEGYYDGYLA